MPWCETCERHQNPGALAPDGTCPVCGDFIASPDDEPAEDEDSGAPWHFYVLVVALVIYLGWRVIQLIGAVIGWL